jgi:hypothetical protein
MEVTAAMVVLVVRDPLSPALAVRGAMAAMAVRERLALMVASVLMGRMATKAELGVMAALAEPVRPRCDPGHHRCGRQWR